MKKPRPPISEATREKLRQAKLGRTGPQSNHWLGGTAKHINGYVLVRKPDHPNTDASGYVLEHRFVMSEFLGRPLRRHEQVHHRNGDKTDNRIENLELMTDSAHSRMHSRQRGFPVKNRFSGKPHSEESKRKISATRRALFASGELRHPYTGKRRQPDGSFA